MLGRVSENWFCFCTQALQFLNEKGFVLGEFEEYMQVCVHVSVFVRLCVCAVHTCMCCVCECPCDRMEKVDMWSGNRCLNCVAECKLLS